METYRLERDDNGHEWVDIPYRGRALLSHNMYNRGTAFSHAERRKLGLEGLLPGAHNGIEDQCRRVYEHVLRKADPLEQFIGLAALERRNAVLFYRVLLERFEDLMPIVYTPTVGLACEEFSHTFRQGRGLWVTPNDRGRIAEVLDHAPWDDVRLIVVTDNERILGLGDQGAGGMWIPVGKISLYIAGAGFHPTQCLPISLDVGTDNTKLLADDLYLGWRHRRLRGEAYDSLVEEFVEAVRQRFPGALLQWEDFKKWNAFRLVDRYRETLPSFNDDIEGTAAVAVAGVMASTRVSGIPLAEQRVMVVGAGAAGIGIARLFRRAFLEAGLDEERARAAVAVMGRTGILLEGQVAEEAYQGDFAWTYEMAASEGLEGDGPFDLKTTISALSPTVLIGATGQPGLFDEETVRLMASAVERPVICPFSNPTSKSEATPAELLEWTGGRALIATGSPFDPVRWGDRVIRTGQGNNVYIFPGVGLGAVVSGTRRVTEAMFSRAARTVAEMVSDADLEAGSLYPPLTELRAISRRIAFEVGKTAIEEGLAEAVEDDELRRRIDAFMWMPDYAEVRTTSSANDSQESAPR